MSMTFPNESAEYRAARNALLESEIALRRQMEAVAGQLRALPPGGAVMLVQRSIRTHTLLPRASWHRLPAAAGWYW